MGIAKIPILFLNPGCLDDHSVIVNQKFSLRRSAKDLFRRLSDKGVEAIFARAGIYEPARFAIDCRGLPGEGPQALPGITPPQYLQI